MRELLEGHLETRPVAEIDGFSHGYPSLLASALGPPSEAFGSMYEVFDGPRRVARLPGPPYHFMSRLTDIDGQPGVCSSGAVIELEYDVPDEAWYFDHNGFQTETQEKLDQLRDVLVDLGVVEYVAEDEAYEPIVGTYPMVQAQAYFNWIGLVEDRSLGAHNPRYVEALLDNTLEALEQ